MRRIALCSLLLGISLVLLVGCTTAIPLPVIVPVAESDGSEATASDESAITEEEAAAEEEVSSGDVPSDELAPGGSTPEEAVELYMQGIVEGNLQMVIDAAAKRDIARKFAFIRYVQRLQALPIYQAMLPPNDDFAVELNEARSEAQIANQVANLAWKLLAGDIVDTDSGMNAPVDDQWATDVAALMDFSRLGGIELTEIAPSNPEEMATERYQTNAAEIASVYGADEYTEMVAHFTFEGDEYLVGFQLLRYGDEWFVLSQSSPLAGTPATGAPVEE